MSLKRVRLGFYARARRATSRLLRERDTLRLNIYARARRATTPQEFAFLTDDLLTFMGWVGLILTLRLAPLDDDALFVVYLAFLAVGYGFAMIRAKILELVMSVQARGEAQKPFPHSAPVIWLRLLARTTMSVFVAVFPWYLKHELLPLSIAVGVMLFSLLGIADSITYLFPAGDPECSTNEDERAAQSSSARIMAQRVVDRDDQTR